MGWQFWRRGHEKGATAPGPLNKPVAGSPAVESARRGVHGSVTESINIACEDSYRRITFEVQDEADATLAMGPNECWETKLLYGVYKFGRNAVRSEPDGIYVNGNKVSGIATLDGGMKLEFEKTSQNPKIWLYNSGNTEVRMNVFARMLEGGHYTMVLTELVRNNFKKPTEAIPSLRSSNSTDDELPTTQPPASQPAPEMTEDPAEMSAANIVARRDKLLRLDNKRRSDQVSITPGEVAGLSFPAANFVGNYVVQLINTQLMVSVETDGTVLIDGVQIQASGRFERRANMDFALRTMPVPGGANRYLLLIRHPKNMNYAQPITIS